MKIVVIIAIVLAALVAVTFALGARLPVQHSASRKAHLKAAPEAVWTAITSPAEFGGWRKGLKSVEVLAPGRWVEVDSHNQRITIEITESQPPQKLVTTIADKNLPFGGSWTYELAPAAGGTEITITENGEIHNVLFRFMARYVFGYTSTMEQYLEGLKARVES